MVDGIEDRGGRGDQGLLADALGTEGTDRGGTFHQDGGDGRHVADGGNQVVVEVLALAGDELLHQRHADALGDTALDLALDQHRIDGAAHIMGGGDRQHLHSSQAKIDLDFSEMGAIAIDGVGHTLAVGVERAGGRIEGLFGAFDIAEAVSGEMGQFDRADEVRFVHEKPGVGDFQFGSAAGVGEAQ